MLAGLLVACGQRGPLYLPEDSPPAATSQDDGNELEEDPEHEDEVHSGSFEDGQPN
jgi:predicted small lipoprotein YifL